MDDITETTEVTKRKARVGDDIGIIIYPVRATSEDILAGNCTLVDIDDDEYDISSGDIFRTSDQKFLKANDDLTFSEIELAQPFKEEEANNFFNEADTTEADGDAEADTTEADGDAEVADDAPEAEEPREDTKA